MTRINARACDHCGGLGTPVAGNARRLPNGWIYLTTSRAESREVCGWDCLAGISNAHSGPAADKDTP